MLVWINFSTFAAIFWEEVNVNYLKQFVIPFNGLKPGIYQYDFKVDDQFFEALDYSIFKHGAVKVIVLMTKQERMLIFDFELRGAVEVNCDRCLDQLNYSVDCDKRLIFKFGDDWQDLSDEIIIIPESEYQIDIAHYLYEYISLMIPIKCIHPDNEKGESTCNAEMLKYLGHRPEKSGIDPRWDALKNLKSND